MVSAALIFITIHSGPTCRKRLVGFGHSSRKCTLSGYPTLAFYKGGMHVMRMTNFDRRDGD